MVVLHVPDRGQGGRGEARIWRGGTDAAEVITFADGVRPVAVDAVRTQRGGFARLLFAVAVIDGDGGLYESRPGADGRYAAPTRAQLDGREATLAGAGTGVVGADVNLDGLDDLILTYGDDPASVRAGRVYLQTRVAGGVTAQEDP